MSSERSGLVKMLRGDESFTSHFYQDPRSPSSYKKLRSQMETLPPYGARVEETWDRGCMSIGTVVLRSPWCWRVIAIESSSDSSKKDIVTLECYDPKEDW